MHVAICIVGYRNVDDIAACLEALGRSTYRDFEVVITENGGAAAFAALGERLPKLLPGGQKVRLHVARGNLGYAGGVNNSIEQSRHADAWWVLNPDTVPAPQALEELVGELTKGKVQMLGGIVLDDDEVVGSYGGRWRGWLARAESIGTGKRADAPIDRAAVERKLSYISGASLIVSRDFVETVGLMREDYFLYAEEIEWSLRGLELGMKLGLAPAARVYHKLGTTTGSGGEMKTRPKLPIYLDERNKLLVTRDRFPARLPVAALGSLALILLRYGRRGAWRQLGYALQGWGAGLANERGAPPDLVPDRAT